MTEPKYRRGDCFLFPKESWRKTWIGRIESFEMNGRKPAYRMERWDMEDKVRRECLMDEDILDKYTTTFSPQKFQRITDLMDACHLGVDMIMLE